MYLLKHGMLCSLQWENNNWEVLKSLEVPRDRGLNLHTKVFGFDYTIAQESFGFVLFLHCD